jgi:hypothetical protein
MNLSGQRKNYWANDNKGLYFDLEQEEDEINPTIRKFSRKWKDQPCDQEESSGQPYNQETLSFQTPWLGSIKSTVQSGCTKFSNPVIEK